MEIKDLISEAYKIVGEYHPSEDCGSGSVAAALITKKGKIYTGVCMDFECGIGFCAEHAAIAEMLKHKESEIDMIIAVNTDKVILPPCGRCRELMYQLHKSNMDAKVVITDGKVVTLRELYPHPWKEAWEKK